MKIRNRAVEWRHQHYTWRDFFHRLSSIDRFSQVSRSEKPSHAIDTIEKGLWSLQEQALVYEVVDPERGNVAGIPEDYVDYIREWLYYEMSDENYLGMLEALEPFDRQSTLIEAREVFGIDTTTQGLNEKRQESLVEAGVSPSDLLRQVVTKEELKDIVDEYGLDAHKQKTEQMIEAAIEFFEQFQTVVEEGQPTAELYLKCYEDIADGSVERVPPQLHSVVEDGTQSEKLDILFEKRTAEIFKDLFNLSETRLLGQTASGTVADGEIEQDGS